MSSRMTYCIQNKLAHIIFLQVFTHNYTFSLVPSRLKIPQHQIKNCNKFAVQTTFKLAQRSRQLTKHTSNSAMINGSSGHFQLLVTFNYNAINNTNQYNFTLNANSSQARCT